MRVADSNVNVPRRTAVLLERMVSPLAGTTRTIGVLSRSSGEPRLMTCGGELTGVHVLLGRPDPGPGFYHIGGSGVVPHEALIRCLGESAERYAQFVADVAGSQRIVVASRRELADRGEPALAAGKLSFFSAEQHARAGFPYRAFRDEQHFGWTKAESLTGDPDQWVPAQLLLLGYRRRGDEYRLLSSVTTGTAAHTEPARALAAALLELVQIDSAMGHWYSSATAPRIAPDARVRAVCAFIERFWSRHAERPCFHLLPNPDLPGFTVACVIRNSQVPRVGVGLGIGLRLNRALYGALLEAVGVTQMAKKALMDDPATQETDDEIYDLDANVVMYALAGELLDGKFSDDDRVSASDLPPDVQTDPAGEVDLLTAAFADTGKELFRLDLTTPDLAELGLVVQRVWSPDTLSLCLPSAPPVMHHRFEAYGGASNRRPHPYP